MLAQAQHAPRLLDTVGYSAPTEQPVCVLPNGIELHRWPSKYLTDEVRALVSLFTFHEAGVPLVSGALASWPAWLADAVRVLGSETRAHARWSEVARG